MISRLAIILAFFSAVFSSCSLENTGLRQIRGHLLDKKGVAHASSFAHAERYCSHCHGQNLRGGDSGQPSCYQCHGLRWAETGPDRIFAPTDTHTLDRGSYLHHASLADVQGTCTTCHGVDLQGDGTLGTPSCFLCHEQVW